MVPSLNITLTTVGWLWNSTAYDLRTCTFDLEKV